MGGHAMTVDERLAGRWRRQHAERPWAKRSPFHPQSPEASMWLAYQRMQPGPAPPNVDTRYKGLWQQARIELWRTEDEDLSHEAYVAWWRDNGGEGEGYSMAHHAENHMTRLTRAGAFRGLTPVQVYDRLLCRYSPLLAAEGFRRWLAAHAGPPFAVIKRLGRR